MKDKASTIKAKAKWKPVKFDEEELNDLEFEGFTALEELTDYEIVKEGRPTLSRREKSVKDSTKKKRKRQGAEKPSKRKKQDLEDVENDLSVEPNMDEEVSETADDVDMSAWLNCFVPPAVLKALGELKFTKPTQIQSLTLPSAIRDHMDIMGAAETGSGKTLAFGIPIIHHILEQKSRVTADAKSKPLYALILTPTRELAIQINAHLKAIAKYTSIRIVNVIGGLSMQKQIRLLKRRPEIVVATPGRLWELIEMNTPHLTKIENIRYLVIDEADRMVEKGHFEDLSKLLALINAMPSEGEKRRRQNFVFSATLTLVHDMPDRLKNRRRKRKLTENDKLEKLMRKIGVSAKPKVVDITRKLGTAETLSESRLMCPSLEEKDSRLYYFLLAHPGRTIVFCNSIDCVRRLRSVLEHLNCSPLPLHASMAQRQRLKNLDRFRTNPTGLLLATDVAARGLDIQGIEHVVHFQVPRTAEVYIHRSGRTARAQTAGLSVMLVEPKELATYRKICRTLNREEDLPEFPLDVDILNSVRERVLLARKLESEEHKVRRRNYDNNWFQRAAEEMDIEVDEILLDKRGEKETADDKRRLSVMQAQLAKVLKRPLFPSGFSGRYLTQHGELKLPKAVGEERAVDAVERAAEKKKKWSKKVISTKLSENALKVKQKLRRIKKKKQLKDGGE
uniref:ATP-dependent RNA helicase n=1 Tax=Ornithodoros turicata TaxID=34597 RepID=A0A2R5LA45_9ACAR